MKAIKAKVPRCIVRGSKLEVCDNSGAKIAYLVSVKGSKTVKGRYPTAGIGDLVNVSIIKGSKEIRKHSLHFDKDIFQGQLIDNMTNNFF